MKALLFLLILLLPVPVLAQEAPINTFPPGEDKIVPVSAGDPVPFSGQLFDDDTAIRWGNWLEQYRLRLPLDVALQKKVDEARITALEGTLQTEREAAQESQRLYAERIKSLEEQLVSPPWYSTPEFGIAVGVVSTLAIIGVTAGVLSAVTPGG